MRNCIAFMSVAFSVLFAGCDVTGGLSGEVRQLRGQLDSALMDLRAGINLAESELPLLRAESDKWNRTAEETLQRANRWVGVDAPNLTREMQHAASSGSMDAVENFEARLRTALRTSYREIKAAREMLNSSRYRSGDESAVLTAMKRINSETLQLPPRVRHLSVADLQVCFTKWQDGTVKWLNENETGRLKIWGWGLSDETFGSGPTIAVRAYLRDDANQLFEVSTGKLSVSSDHQLLLDINPILQVLAPNHKELVLWFEDSSRSVRRELPIAFAKPLELPPAPPIVKPTDPNKVIAGLQVIIETDEDDKDPDGEIAIEAKTHAFQEPLIVHGGFGKTEHWPSGTVVCLRPSRLQSTYGIADDSWYAVDSVELKRGDSVALRVTLNGMWKRFGIFNTGVSWMGRFKLRFKCKDGTIGETAWTQVNWFGSFDLESGKKIRDFEFQLGRP